jgi:hypothetical protein
MIIPKRFKRIGDKKLCHLVDVIMDGDTQLIIYKQWIPWKKYWVYKVIEGDALYEEFYYVRYGKFPDYKEDE